jgi:alcohol dehydrogenase
LRVSLNPVSLLTAPGSLWGLLKLGWGWLWRPKLDVLNMPGDNKGVLGFNLIWLYDKLEILAGLYEKVDRLELEPPVVGRVFGFEQLPDALRYLQSGESVGKVVLSADPGALQNNSHHKCDDTR